MHCVVSVVVFLLILSDFYSYGLRFSTTKAFRRPQSPRHSAISFYKFRLINDQRINELIPMIEHLLKHFDVKGTVYLANEGYNGQCVVKSSQIDALKLSLLSIDHDLFGDIELNEESQIVDESKFPYSKLLVRRKAKALNDGLTTETLDWTDSGRKLDASQWQQELLQQSNQAVRPLLLDCRNDYESNVGTFRGAIPLNTTIFSESFSVLDSLLANEPKNRPILTFCTGGIRCVKVNAYLKQRLGFQNIGRLEKGIIGYDKWRQDQLNDTNSSSSSDDRDSRIPNLFVGKNFIFNKSRIGSEII